MATPTPPALAQTTTNDFNDTWPAPQVAAWLAAEFPELVPKFTNKSGKHLAKYSKEDLIAICGEADGRALYNEIHPNAPPLVPSSGPSAGPATVAGNVNQNNTSTIPYDVQALALPNDFFSQQRLGIHFEGLKATPWALRRQGLCAKLCNIVEHEATKRLLVRGPFCSGKTAFGQLIHYHLTQEKKTAYIVTLLGNDASWEDCWFCQTNVQWASIMRSEQPVYVIIDEVQKSYSLGSNTHGLWEKIKASNQRGAQNNVYYFCIGSYGDLQQGSATPLDFPPNAIISLHPHNSTPGLAYMAEEFLALCKLFMECGGFEIDERSANYILHLSGGHPGIIGSILKSMYEHAKNFELDGLTAKEELYKYLHSMDFHDSLRNSVCRAIPNFSDFARDKSVQEKGKIRDVCKRVLCGASFTVPYDRFDEDDNDVLTRCLKASLLVLNGDRHVTFASPVVQNRALAHFFSETQGVDPTDLHTFIIDVVQRFSPTQLQRTESKDTKSRIMEAQWQQEFYRVAASLLPRDAVISPEYGREQGALGQVDFYISKYNWMIEILRDGIDLVGHEQRFEAGGKYAPLINGGNWCVVDFRADKTVRRKSVGHTYHVMFMDNKTGFVIRHPSGEKQVFSVLGDKVSEVKSDRKPGQTPGKLSSSKKM